MAPSPAWRLLYDTAPMIRSRTVEETVEARRGHGVALSKTEAFVSKEWRENLSARILFYLPK